MQTRQSMTDEQLEQEQAKRTETEQKLNEFIEANAQLKVQSEELETEKQAFLAQKEQLELSITKLEIQLKQATKAASLTDESPSNAKFFFFPLSQNQTL